MTTKDYSKVRATALRLVEKYGRSVSLLALKSVPEEAAKPWDGQKDATTATETAVPTKAVFVPLTDGDELGISTEFMARFKDESELALVPGQSVAIETYAFLDEPDGTRWTIKSTETLKPGDTAVLHFLEVAR